MSMENILSQAKVPTTRNNYVGIEIEFLIHNKVHDKLAQMLIKSNLQWNVHLGHDASVQDTDFVPEYSIIQLPWGRDRQLVNHKDKWIGKEIRIIVVEDEAPDMIKKVCEILAKCEAKVNKTCGLHVHLDMRTRDIDHVYNNMFYLQNIMFKMQPPERKSGQYSKSLTKLNFESFNKCTDKDLQNKNRYHAINKVSYARHRTLEIRLHEGSVNDKDIRRWVYMLIKIANMKEKLVKGVTKIDNLDVPEAVKEYVHERIKKFA